MGGEDTSGGTKEEQKGKKRPRDGYSEECQIPIYPSSSRRKVKNNQIPDHANNDKLSLVLVYNNLMYFYNFALHIYNDPSHKNRIYLPERKKGCLVTRATRKQRGIHPHVSDSAGPCLQSRLPGRAFIQPPPKTPLQAPLHPKIWKVRRRSSANPAHSGPTRTRVRSTLAFFAPSPQGEVMGDLRSLGWRWEQHLWD
jgi:hypothetical protein